MLSLTSLSFFSENQFFRSCSTLWRIQCMKVKSESEVAQSCPTLIDPMDCSLPSSSVHGIFLARVLEWLAIAFSSRLAEALLNGWVDSH